MSAAREMGAGEAAFALCELEWMRTRVLVQLSCMELSEFAEEIVGGVAEAKPDLLGRVRSAIEEVEALVLSFGHRLASLPVDSVFATRDDVGAAAAAALADGIADAERALHAAQWVELRPGVRALASALTSSDAHRFWEVRVERFLAAFHGSNRQVARSIANEAEVTDLLFSELTDQQVVRLAAVLRWAHGDEG